MLSPDRARSSRRPSAVLGLLAVLAGALCITSGLVFPEAAGDSGDSRGFGNAIARDYLSRLAATGAAVDRVSAELVGGRQDETGCWWPGFCYPGVSDTASTAEILVSLIYEENLIVAGDFAFAGGLGGHGVPTSGIACWDGISWNAIGSGFDNEVYDLATYGEDLVAGGAFDHAGGEEVNRVARWDGETWVALGDGFNNVVHALVVYDGNLIAGGEFTESGASTINHLAAWDGSSWTEFAGGTSAPVRVLGIHDGDLVAGGPFAYAGGQTVNRIGRWDGSGWYDFDGGISPDNGWPLTMTSHQGQLVIGGTFTQVGGIVAHHVARWAGDQWLPIGSGDDQGVGDDAHSVLSLGDDLYVGGDFEEAGRIHCSHIARWDGEDWHPVGAGLQGRVSCFCEGGGFLHAGGLFSLTEPDDAGYQVRLQCVGRWQEDTWQAFGRGMNNTIHDWTLLDDNLIAGGSFEHAGGAPAPGVARWEGDGWSALGDLASGVHTVETFGGALIAGGAFTGQGDELADHIARWDGHDWLPLREFDQPDAAVSTLYPFGDSLIVGGRFENIGGGPAFNSIAAWDGGQWQPMGNGFAGGGAGCDVRALTCYEEELYAGGEFTGPGDLRYFARWDGSDWSEVGGGMNGAVHALVVYDDGVNAPLLIVSGEFGAAGGQPMNCIAGWDGSDWVDLAGGMDAPVRSLGIYNGTLFAGGEFTMAGNASAPGIARWNGMDDWVAVGAGIEDGTVSALCPHEGRLYAGGDFFAAGGEPASCVARWWEYTPDHPDTVIYEDLPHWSEGESYLDHLDTLLVAGNISASGVDGVGIGLPQALVWGADWLPDEPLTDSAYVQTLAFGELGDRAGEYVGEVMTRCLDPESPVVTLDFACLDAQTLHYQAFLLGAPVYDYTGEPEPFEVHTWIAGDDDLFNRTVEITVDTESGLPTFAVGWSDTIALVPPDDPPQWLPVDRLTVEPVDATQTLEYLDGIRVLGANIDQLRILGEWFERGPANTGDERAAPSAAPHLSRVFPNPAGDALTIAYRLAVPARVVLEVFDLQGRRIRQLLDERRSAGEHRIVWDGRNDSGVGVAPGLYFTRLRAGRAERAEKLVVVR